MGKEEEKKETVYEIFIARNDMELPMTVYRSAVYEECYEKWQKLYKQWQETSEENKAFVIEDPIVTAFNPVLIREITLRPIVEQSAGKYKNPYQREMIDKGFSEVFGNRGELMDNGYK